MLNRIEEIKGLSDLIHPNKMEGFSMFKNDKTKIRKLYNLIRNGENDPNILAKKLGYENADVSSFKKLVYKLSQKLKSSLFFLDDSKSIFSDLGGKYYNLLKATLESKALNMLGKRNLTISATENTIKKAEHYEFPELALSLAPNLILYYGYINQNKKKI